MTIRTKNHNSYTHGGWNVICDVCGFKFKNCDVKKRWDGLYVCKDDWEPRHPSDFVKGVKDDPSVPFTRPDTTANASYTDVAGNAVTNELYTDTHGDESDTITYGTDNDIQDWNTTLTANRVCTVADGTAISGNRFTIYRTGAGAFTFEINDGSSIRTIPASVTAICVIEFDGTNWSEVSYTTIGR